MKKSSPDVQPTEAPAEAAPVADYALTPERADGVPIHADAPHADEGLVVVALTDEDRGKTVLATILSIVNGPRILLDGKYYEQIETYRYATDLTSPPLTVTRYAHTPR